MSVRVMSWVWDHSQTRGTDRLVLLAVADNAADDGDNAWPSIDRIVTKTRLSRSSVHRALGRLVKLGELKITRCGGGTPDTPADRRPNRYRIIMSADERGPSVGPRDASTGSHCGTPGVPGCDSRGPRLGPEPSIEPSINHPITRDGAQLDLIAENPGAERGAEDQLREDFEEAWIKYPRKIAKQTAWKHYRATRRKGVSAEQLLRATENYHRECDLERRESKFVKHGGTFFGPAAPWRDYLREPEPEDDPVWEPVPRNFPLTAATR